MIDTVKLDKKALVKYLCSLLLFGSNGIVATHIAMSSYEIVFTRTFIGSLLLVVIFLAVGGRFTFKGKGRDLAYVALSGLAMAAGWIFLYEGYRYIGVGLSTLLYYCGPVIVMVLAPLIFKEKMTAPKVVGFLIVLAGVFLVSGKVGLSDNKWGLFCGLMSAIMFFLMVTLNKKSTKIVGMENAVIQLIASFITVTVFIGFKQHFVIHIPVEDWVWILTLGIVNTGISCYLYFSSLSKLPVQTVATCGYLEPLSAVVFAAIFLGETMTSLQIIGAACIIGGALIGELVKGKRRDGPV